ncbi:hypothetical protein EDD86DRAFT_202285 [Gorgonomyces haynaldii]|nr:hypothetical protein EDD86DRAFT_202285 [Gorgonomyces haynaldii]
MIDWDQKLTQIEQEIKETKAKIATAEDAEVEADDQKQKQKLQRQVRRLKEELQDLKAYRKEVVDAAKEPAAKRRKTLWSNAVSVTPINYDTDSTLLRIPSDYLKGSGLHQGDLLMYCRQGFQDQMRFMQETVIRDSHIGWVLGPPGAGKSTTALAFAATLHQWPVTWIHLSTLYSPYCIRIQNGQKQTCVINYASIDDILPEDLEEHLLIIDGCLQNSNQSHQNVLNACNTWVANNRDQRRLLCVSSLAARGKTKLHEEREFKITTHYVYSWTLEEYYAAMEHREFCDAVRENLDASQAESPKEMIDAKYFYAGGSSRYMFDSSTEQVKELIEEAVGSIASFERQANPGYSTSSSDVVHRLVSIYPLEDRKRLFWTAVSAYAASRLAASLTPAAVRNLYRAIDLVGNPSIAGWFTEALFFSGLQHGGLKVYDKEGNQKATWAAESLLRFDPKSVPTLETTEQWMQPSIWNQGGYDAVYVDKSNKSILLVQVTRAETHSFLIQHFANFVNGLLTSNKDMKKPSVRIAFAVDRTKARNFKISTVSGQGSLKKYGWREGKEKDMVEILGVDGL